MERFIDAFEQIFSAAAMAEENVFPELIDDLKEAVEHFECNAADAAFAEAGEFAASFCAPRGLTLPLAWT